MKYINEELFVASLRTGHFDSTHQKLFERRFPSYGHGDPLLTYLSCVMEHALQYKFFIPPLQKLRPDCLLGSWEQGALPPWVRLAAVTTMPGILANCLHSKTAHLYCDSSYGAIVQANENGYETFRQLASLAGHPSLSPFPVTRDPPKQRADRDVAHHLEDWKRYLECCAMAGVFLQDRYFVTSFLCSLHPSIQHFFSSHLEPLVYAVPSNRPLPDAYSPRGMTSYLLQYATQREAVNYITESPRSLRSGSQHQVVRSIQASFAPPDQLVAAVGSDRVCHLCHKPGHLFDDCPLLKQILGDPNCQRRLQQKFVGGNTCYAGHRPPGTLTVNALEDMLMTFDADTDNLDNLSVGTLDAGVELTSVPENEAAADDPDFREAHE
jgi:hypothetical protein